MSFEAILGCIVIGAMVGIPIGGAIETMPSEKQRNCEFCHAKRRNGSSSYQLILGKCGHEVTEARYCPKCGRKLYEDEDGDK